MKLLTYDIPHRLMGQDVVQRGCEVGDRELCREFVAGLDKVMAELEGLGSGDVKEVTECVSIMRGWCEVGGKQEDEGEEKGKGKVGEEKRRRRRSEWVRSWGGEGARR